MFSHVIDNPNNFVIQQKTYNVIPFGHRCTSAIACNYANIRKCSLPFDWNVSLFPSKIKEVLTHNFADFIPNMHNKNIHNKYNIGIAHFNSNIDKGIEEYKRRIIRFNDIIQQPNKLYFVYINEDYLFKQMWRDEEYNMKMFNEMLDLEMFLKEKYANIDFNILYFNFIKHPIPKTSNIINIVLHTTNIYDTNDGNVSTNFRIYCGTILAELFNTTLNLESYNFHN